MMLPRALVAALLSISFLVPGASAQTAQRWSIQLSALGVQLTGVENENLEFGAGLELQARWNPSAFSLGLGVQTTRHELRGVNVRYDGLFLEPRYILTTLGDAVALYASARLMALSATIEVPGLEVEVDGSAIAGGGGLLIRLGSRVNGEIGLTVGKEFYEREAVEGSTVVTRIGLAIGLG